MALRFDSREVPKGFGALDASQIARLDAVVERARQSRDEAWSLVPGLFSSMWSTAIGASSSVEALQANARAATTLYETLLDRRNRLANDPNATDYDVQVVEGAVPALSNEAAQEASYLLTPGAAVLETAKGTIEDITGAVKSPFGVPWWIWIAGAGALALFIVLPKGRRS